MKLKTLVLSVVAGMALVGAQAAMACSTAAWGQGTPAPPPGGAGAVAGEPDDTPTAVARYSGRCGLLSAAAAQFVSDGNPQAESRLRARFYVKPNLTGASAVVFQGSNSSDTQVIAVAYNPATSSFDFTSGAATASVTGIVNNRWYGIELDWNVATNNMAVSVKGNAGAAQTTTVAAAAGQIDHVRLGWISGAATGSVTTDAYESRRATAIGYLCRGDANGDSGLSVQDRIVLTNEILGTALSPGQPDANEDGGVSVQDRIVLTNRILAVDACP